MTDADLKSRRWFKWSWLTFSLRSLFVVVTVFACWLGWELNWIKSRRQMIDNYEAIILDENPRIMTAWISRGNKPPRAPGLLWLLGESGVAQLRVVIKEERAGDGGNNSDSHQRMERARRLFPEAEISYHVRDIEVKDIEFLNNAMPVPPTLRPKHR